MRMRSIFPDANKKFSVIWAGGNLTMDTLTWLPHLNAGGHPATMVTDQVNSDAATAPHVRGTGRSMVVLDLGSPCYAASNWGCSSATCKWHRSRGRCPSGQPRVARMSSRADQIVRHTQRTAGVWMTRWGAHTATGSQSGESDMDDDGTRRDGRYEGTRERETRPLGGSVGDSRD
jgi:hypothetical protein